MVGQQIMNCPDVLSKTNNNMIALDPTPWIGIMFCSKLMKIHKLLSKSQDLPWLLDPKSLNKLCGLSNNSWQFMIAGPKVMTIHDLLPKMFVYPHPRALIAAKDHDGWPPNNYFWYKHNDVRTTVHSFWTKHHNVWTNNNDMWSKVMMFMILRLAPHCPNEMPPNQPQSGRL